MQESLLAIAETAQSFTYKIFPFVFWSLCIIAVIGLFNKAKGIAAPLLVAGSYALGFHLWVTACVYSLALAKFWIFIVSVLFLGVGVFPLSIVTLGIYKQWEAAGLMLLGIVFAYGFRILGFRYRYTYERDR